VFFGLGLAVVFNKTRRIAGALLLILYFLFLWGARRRYSVQVNKELTPQDSERAQIVVIPATIGVKQLAELLGLNAIGLIDDLMSMNHFVTLHHNLTYDTAKSLAAKYGIRVVRETSEPANDDNV
jgi:hypothetical protein